MTPLAGDVLPLHGCPMPIHNPPDVIRWGVQPPSQDFNRPMMIAHNPKSPLNWLYFLAFAILIFYGTTRAFAFDNGQYGDVPDNIRSWFKGVKSPNGIPCCDIADGHRTTWRGTSTGGYEVPIEGEWAAVPPESVVYNAGNPTGEAIVWYVVKNAPAPFADRYHIRCFVPG